MCDVCMMYLTAKSTEFPLSVSTDIPQTHHTIVYSTFFSGQLSGFPTAAAGQEREPRGSAATSCRRSERAGSGAGSAPPPGAPRHDRNSPENQQNICFLPSSHWNGLQSALVRDGGWGRAPPRTTPVKRKSKGLTGAPSISSQHPDTPCSPRSLAACRSGTIPPIPPHLL